MRGQGPRGNSYNCTNVQKTAKTTLPNFDFCFQSLFASRLTVRASTLFFAVPPPPSPFSPLSLLLLLPFLRCPSSSSSSFSLVSALPPHPSPCSPPPSSSVYLWSQDTPVTKLPWPPSPPVLCGPRTPFSSPSPPPRHSALGARMRLDAALEAAEDGHVAGLQVRSAVRRDEAQHDVRECGPHGGQGGLAGVDAGHVPEKDPRLSLPAWIEHAVQCGCELQERRRRGPAVLRCDVVGALRPGLLRQLPACTICTSMSSGPRPMLKA